MLCSKQVPLIAIAACEQDISLPLEQFDLGLGLSLLGLIMGLCLLGPAEHGLHQCCGLVPLLAPFRMFYVCFCAHKHLHAHRYTFYAQLYAHLHKICVASPSPFPPRTPSAIGHTDRHFDDQSHGISHTANIPFLEIEVLILHGIRRPAFEFVQQ